MTFFCRKCQKEPHTIVTAPWHDLHGTWHVECHGERTTVKLTLYEIMNMPDAKRERIEVF